MSNQLDTTECLLFEDLGRKGCERLARIMYEDGLYQTEQGAKGDLSKCANPNSDNAIHLRNAKRILRACRGQATWLDDLIVYRAQLQEKESRRQMRTVRPGAEREHRGTG